MLNGAEHITVKWVVENNAMLQARNDADTTPYYKIADILNDPTSVITMGEVLDSWSVGPRTNAVFYNLSKELFDKMESSERIEYVKLWCNLYKHIVIDLLSKRLGEHRAS